MRSKYLFTKQSSLSKPIHALQLSCHISSGVGRGAPIGAEESNLSREEFFEPFEVSLWRDSLRQMV